MIGRVADGHGLGDVPCVGHGVTGLPDGVVQLLRRVPLWPLAVGVQVY